MGLTIRPMWGYNRFSFFVNVMCTVMLAIDRKNETFLYQQVIDFIGEKIESGTLLPGDKLPSLRRLSDQIGGEYSHH